MGMGVRSERQGVAAGAEAGTLFGLSVKLLTVGWLWSPPDSAPEASRQRFRVFSLVMGTFLVVNAIGEFGGLVNARSDGLERVCQSICSFLWRFLSVCEFILFRRHARAIQALVRDAERLALVDHGVEGLAKRRVEALQEQDRRLVKRIFQVYVGWFTYSSTAVVTHPLVEWGLSGQRPQPLLSSNFWFIVGPDTTSREMVMFISQSVAQYTCTIIAVGYVTLFSGLTFHLAYQCRIVGVLLEHASLAESKRSSDCESAVRRRVVHCIKFHQDILNVAAELNRVLCLMLMLLFMMVLAFIATMVYQMAVVPPNNAIFIATLMILICTNSQIAVLCYGSDSLRGATEDVVHRVMACDWTDAPQSIQRLLYIVVFRATKPTSLWAWRVFSVSLPTWIQVLNKAYSVFAVLRSSDK